VGGVRFLIGWGLSRSSAKRIGIYSLEILLIDSFLIGVRENRGGANIARIFLPNPLVTPLVVEPWVWNLASISLSLLLPEI